MSRPLYYRPLWEHGSEGKSCKKRSEHWDKVALRAFLFPESSVAYACAVQSFVEMVLTCICHVCDRCAIQLGITQFSHLTIYVQLANLTSTTDSQGQPPRAAKDRILCDFAFYMCFVFWLTISYMHLANHPASFTFSRIVCSWDLLSLMSRSCEPLVSSPKRCFSLLLRW
jgi:hypothetical protein